MVCLFVLLHVSIRQTERRYLRAQEEETNIVSSLTLKDLEFEFRTEKNKMFRRKILTSTDNMYSIPQHDTRSKRT